MTMPDHVLHESADIFCSKTNADDIPWSAKSVDLFPIEHL